MVIACKVRTNLSEIVFESNRKKFPWFTWPHLHNQGNFGFIN